MPSRFFYIRNQSKRWKRQWKLDLIELHNPRWDWAA